MYFLQTFKRDNMKQIFSRALLVFVFFTLSCSSKDDDYYYSKGQEAEIKKDYQGQHDNYLTIVEKFPKSKHHSNALFYLGYINANHFNDTTKAKEYYNIFLKSYPKHELVESVKFELNYMGKPLSQLPFLNELK